MDKLTSCREQFGNYDFVDFAQEFLRRNPDYRTQYDRLGEAARRTPALKSCREMADSWGLEFPFRT